MNGPPTFPESHPQGRWRSRLRLLFAACAVALAAAATTVAIPGAADAATCSNQTGTTNGFYNQMWSAGQGSACITVGSGGNSYSTTWSGIGDFVGGVGWQPGSNQTVSFSGSMNASGGTALASLYGWSTNPLVEYYVIEDDQGGSPSLGTFMGTTTSDGATYNLYEHQQVNQPCITGNSCTFEQYLAIRQGNTTSGTITTQNFFNAWASHGMNLGSLNYQIFATEAWGGGSGSSNFTVSHGSSGGGGGGGGGGGRRLWQLHGHAVGRHDRQQLVQPQRRGLRLEYLDRDGEHGRAVRRLLDLERQRHLAQPVRHESHAQRQRQQLELHGLPQRDMDLALGLLQYRLAPGTPAHPEQGLAARRA